MISRVSRFPWIFRSKRCHVGLPSLLVSLMVAGATTLLPAAERDAELRTVLQSATRACRKARNLSYLMREYQRIEGYKPPENETTRPAGDKLPEGYLLNAEFQATIDRVGNRFRYEGRELSFHNDGRPPDYPDFQATFDGSLYRAYWPARKNGFVRVDRQAIGVRRTLDFFLGDSIVGVGVLADNLTQWLETPEGWSFESAEGGAEPQLVRRCRIDAHPVEMTVKVTLSPEHDYLPRQIETYLTDTNTIYQKLWVEQFHQVKSDTIWLPVRGWTQGYSREPIFPAGVTHERYEAMSAEEKQRVDPQITFRAAPTGAPILTVIEPDSIRINEDIADARFELEFPADAQILDERTQQLMRGGKTPIPRENEPNAIAPQPFEAIQTRPLWQSLVAVNAALFALLALGWYVWQRRRG